MSRFDIKSTDGSVTRYSGKLKYHGIYLSPSYIEFTQICSDTPIAFAIGDYVDYDRTGKNVRYRLYSLPMPKRNAGNGSHGESFTYSNVQLFNESKILELAPCRDLAYVDGQPYFSSKSDFAVFITVADLGIRIQENLNRYEGADRWRVRVQSGLEGYNETEARNVSISGSCLSALAVIYDVWPGLGWIFAYETDPTDEELHPTIIIGGANKRTSANTTNRYEYGSGLVSLKKSISNAEEFSTRLRVFGSTRNMPANWYSRRTDIYNAEGTFIPNLMLPFTHDGQDVWGKTDGKYDADKAYFEDADAIAKYGLIEKSVYFDGSNNSEIYPSIEGVTIAELKTAKTAVGKTDAGKPDFFPQSSAGITRIDAIKAITDPIIDDGDIGQDSPYIEDVTQKVTINWHIEATPSGTSRTAIWQSALQAHTFTHEGSVVVSITPLLLTYVQNQYSMINAIRYQLVYRVNGTPIDKYSDWKLVVGGEQISENEQLITFPDYITVGDFDNIVSGQVTVRLEVEVYIPHPSQGHPYEYYITSLDDSAVTFRMRPLLKDRFQIRIPQIGFDMASAVGTPTLSMRSGMCTGREFVVVGTQYESNTDTWLVTLNRETDTSLNRRFPNTDSNIAVGDTFVILGVNMPEEYIMIASERLYIAGKELFDKNKTPIPAYEPQLDSKYILERIEDNPDDDTYVLREGKYMDLLDDPLTANTDEYVIIDTLTIAEDESNIPVYSVTLRDLKSISFARGVETAIRGINVSLTNLANTGSNVTEADKQRWNNKQDAIIDLQEIRENADSAVQPSDIADMETQTHASATYAPKATTYTKSETDGLLEQKADKNDVQEIQAVIPDAATDENPLVDTASMNQAIEAVEARGLSYNAQGDAFPTKASLDNATTFFYGGSAVTPTNNDIVYVLADEGHDGGTTKYALQNGVWAFRILVNESPMTQEQLNALNSGITEAKRQGYDNPTFTEASALANITSGESASTLWGKVKKAISSLITHIADDVRHITSAERTAWNGKQSAIPTTEDEYGITYQIVAQLAKGFQIQGGQITAGQISSAISELYNTKQDKIDSSHKLAYSLISGTPTIGNGTIFFTLGTGPYRTDHQMFTLNQTGNKIIGLYRGSHIQIEHTAESGSLSPEGFTISTDIVDADATHKGLVTTDAQTLAGDKTFTGNVTSNKQIVGKQGVAAKGISDLAIPAIKGVVQDYKDLIHKTDTASGNTYPFALDAEYKRQYLVLTLTEVQTAVTFDTSTPCAEQYILFDNPDDTAKTVSVVSSLANGLVVGDTAIEVAAYESVEVSLITTAADASEYDSSWTGKLCVVTSHAIKWD